MITKLFNTIILITVSCLSFAQDIVSENVSCKEAFKLIQEHKSDSTFVILDLRPWSVYNVEHIENAVSYDVFSEDFDLQISKQDRNKTYLLYCNIGNRSSVALEKMKQMGFKKLYHMHQGITEWKKQGYKTTRGNT